nr:VOC family protein [Mammaliicoccus sp. Marseille-Q6498]
MLHSAWFNLPVENLEKSAAFFEEIGFEINRNPDMLGKMIGIQVSDSSIIILIEKSHFEKISHNPVKPGANEVMISLGVKENKDVDEILEKVEASNGKVLQHSTKLEGYYGGLFEDLDGHKFNLLVC